MKNINKHEKWYSNTLEIREIHYFKLAKIWKSANTKRGKDTEQEGLSESAVQPLWRMTGNTQCAAILPLGTNSREAATYAQEDTHQQHLIAKCGNNQRFRWHTTSTLWYTPECHTRRDHCYTRLLGRTSYMMLNEKTSCRNICAVWEHAVRSPRSTTWRVTWRFTHVNTESRAGERHAHTSGRWLLCRRKMGKRRPGGHAGGADCITSSFQCTARAARC